MGGGPATTTTPTAVYRDTDSDLGDDSPRSNDTADEHDESDHGPAADGESSDEGVNVNRAAPPPPLPPSAPPSETPPQTTTTTGSRAKMTSGMEFGRSPPDHHSELSQATQAAAAAAALGHNHPLGVLSNLTALNMNMPGSDGAGVGVGRVRPAPR
ncbi:hypothetical protein AND_001157 [Anopheles darlingi]|uniref:Uncharacterized protein n=1 Tax=Anopheles darlingi TaxID=43151 RepID=W5JUT5_ANODA|nr:hypothetical protein AND_001157 [Anopheles darlingi]